MNYLRILIATLKQYLNRKAKFAFSSTIDENSFLAGNTAIYKNVKIRKSKIGEGSYISEGSVINRCIIGKYCSIGKNLKIVNAKHPIEKFVSTHPCFYSPKKQAGFTFSREIKYDEQIFLDVSHTFSVIIGNDVWIGDDVTIMAGLSVGDGAVIGTKALVTKDVEPYSIVGGVPAKVIKMRFDDETRKRLLVSKWWELPMDWIKENFEIFSDVEKFLNKVEKR